MQKLIKQINEIKKSEVSKIINNRLNGFSSFKDKHTNEWFSELCFCILTANSKAITAINIQNDLGSEGFINASPSVIRNTIIRSKHRFHNNKTKFIVGARKHIAIKHKLSGLDGAEKREWLVSNIKGLGYKEASHYLRNTGHFNLAILDRHVLNLMVENKLLQEKPKFLNRARYLEIEQKLAKVANKLDMSQAELDMYLWYIKTGKVLK